MDRCYNGFRSVQYGYSDAQIKKFKSRRYEPSNVLEWFPYRKEFNALGFTDEMIKNAIIKHFGKYNNRKDKNKNFNEVFDHWFVKIEQFPQGVKLSGKHEQVSGLFSEGKERITYKGCKEIHEWIKVDNLIEYKVQEFIHMHGLLTDLLEEKMPGIKKFARHRYNQSGFGSWYGEDLNTYHLMNFRTKKGDIYNLRFVDIAKRDIQALTSNNIEKEISDYKNWRKPQIEMNDKDLEAWLKERGYIYVYDGNGHEEENLIKKYIPTVKQERAEWKKDIENIKKRYQDKKWLSFLDFLKNA